MTSLDPPACNSLFRQWSGRERFVVLASGFGEGQDFLQTWASWRADPQRCHRLHYIAIEPCPPTTVDLANAARDTITTALRPELVDAWPALTPNLHRLDFEDGRVQLLLVVAEPDTGLRDLVADVDAFRLDLASATRPADISQPRLCKRLARLAAPQATLVSSSTDKAWVEGLQAAGFVVIAKPADSDSPPSTIGRFAPRFIPHRPPARRATGSGTPYPATGRGAPRRNALIVGAGLAGCATAAALADQGWTVTLADRHASPAAEASGNAAGVFHGVVHARDGHHARFNRAAALLAGRVFRQMLAAAPATHSSGRAGSVDGLLRLGSKLVDRDSMQQMLADLRLPAGFVQAIDADQASMLAGLPLADAAWFYPTGGWMRPAWLATTWLERAANACTFIGGVEVESIRRSDDGWLALDRQGRTIAESANLVLANAGGAQRLLDRLAGRPLDWPLQRVRGQSSQVGLHAGVRAPVLPLSGAGYVLPVIDSALLFGATAQPDDDCPDVRAGDHDENVTRLARLSSSFDAVGRLPPDAFDGRTAWRCVSSDRLPLIGAVPQAWAGGSDGNWDQPRFVAREQGLYLFTALGSRGITWSPLGAEVLAAMMTGAPIPLESSLLDAIDPARFLSRATRRKAAADQAGTGAMQGRAV